MDDEAEDPCFYTQGLVRNRRFPAPERGAVEREQHKDRKPRTRSSEHGWVSFYAQKLSLT